MIAFHQVAKRYGLRAPVLRDVDLELGAGAVVAVQGANGAGKSTLLRLVAGVSAPSRGRIARAPGLRTGYAPEGFAAVAGLTGHGWLRQLARVRGDADAGEEVAAALDAPLQRPLAALSAWPAPARRARGRARGRARRRRPRRAHRGAGRAPPGPRSTAC